MRQLPDAYLSAAESLVHAGIYNSAAVDIEFVHTQSIDTYEKAQQTLSMRMPCFCPAHMMKKQNRGISTLRDTPRENNIPLLGIGAGMMHIAGEYALNVCA